MTDVRNTTRLAGIVVALAIVLIAHTARPGAQNGREPVIRLSETVGPPTTTVVVEGSGFPTGPVVLYFDRDRVGTISTQPGQFSERVVVPDSALPGLHMIKAVGQTSSQSGTASAQTPFKVHTNWPQLGFNARHTGYNPSENVIGPQNANNLIYAWTKNVSSDVAKIKSSPAVVNDRLYITWRVADSDFLSLGSFDVETGSKIWEKALWELNQANHASSPAAANDLVYVATKASVLYALDPKTGSTTWQANTSFDAPNVGSPAVDASRIYQLTAKCTGVVSALHAEVQARDALTGAFIWSQSIGKCADGSPAVANGKVYVIGTEAQTTKQTLYALNAATGAPVWTVVLPPYAFGSPVVAGDRVYVNNYYSVKVYAASNGDSLLSAYLYAPDLAGVGSPAVAYGRIYIGTTSGKLTALDAASGAQVWSSQVPFLSGNVDSSAAVANKVVYVQGFADAEGDLDVIAGFDVDTGVPVFAGATGNDVFVGSGQGPSVAIVNGRVFVGSKDGHIFGFKLP